MLYCCQSPLHLWVRGARPPETTASAFMEALALKTNVHVDGFNLYYGVRDTRYKCLDLSALCRLVLPRNPIYRIRYFTAGVRATPSDPQKPQRQGTYI